LSLGELIGGIMAGGAFAKIVGKRIASVALTSNKEKIVFAFQDGTTQAFVTEGDCCSRSWIEHLEMPNDLAGATLLAVDDSAGVDVTEDKEKNADGHECLQVYGTTFRTDRGDIVLEYRNSSNGYYGGWLQEASS
jgi:hypothetical protein